MYNTALATVAVVDCYMTVFAMQKLFLPGVYINRRHIREIFK